LLTAYHQAGISSPFVRVSKKSPTIINASFLGWVGVAQIPIQPSFPSREKGLEISRGIEDHSDKPGGVIRKDQGPP